MASIKHLFYRIYQRLMVILVKLTPVKKQFLINGTLNQLIPELIKLKDNKFLIITDQGVLKAGLVDNLTNLMKASNLRFEIFDKTVPNPDLKAIDQAYQFYKSANASALIAIGGGSPIDLAKVVAAKVARPKLEIKKMKGILKILKKIPPLIAIPTTAGTGSEVTIAAVVSDHQAKAKYAIIDPNLLPDVALLDPSLTIKMPQFITATTGLDALTHAIECYLGNSSTKETETYSLEAIKLVFENLEVAYNQPANLEARSNMLLASYKAGYAFTRAYVGNVHALSHALGGSYDVVHGLANSVLMPYVFRKYGTSAHQKLANIADFIKISNPNQNIAQKAETMIKAVENLSQKLNMPTKLSNLVKSQDLEAIVNHAYKEANPFYPVPKIFTKQDFLEVLNQATNN